MSKEKPGKKEKIDPKDIAIKELTETLQRLQAEFENYKKRVERERVSFMNTCTKGIIEQALPVLDSFQLALQNTSNQQEFVKGVEMIYGQLYTMLQVQGLKKIEAVNQKFDPYKHEAMLVVKTDTEPDTVVEELLPGYMLNDLVIRHSKVKVSKKVEKND